MKSVISIEGSKQPILNEHHRSTRTSDQVVCPVNVDEADLALGVFLMTDVIPNVRRGRCLMRLG